MGRPPSEKELKRFGRVLAGHAADKDRARWKRKVKGQAKPNQRERRPGAADDEGLDDPGEPEEEPSR
jgi:hypothetical protein